MVEFVDKKSGVNMDLIAFPTSDSRWDSKGSIETTEWIQPYLAKYIKGAEGE